MMSAPSVADPLSRLSWAGRLGHWLYLRRACYC